MNQSLILKTFCEETAEGFEYQCRCSYDAAKINEIYYEGQETFIIKVLINTTEPKSYLLSISYLFASSTVDEEDSEIYFNDVIPNIIKIDEKDFEKIFEFINIVNKLWKEEDDNIFFEEKNIIVEEILKKLA